MRTRIHFPRSVIGWGALSLLLSQIGAVPLYARTDFHAGGTMEPALAAIDAEVQPDRRSKALDATVESISDSDLAPALNDLSRVTGPAARELSQLLVQRWAEQHTIAAVAWANSLPENPHREAVLKQIAIVWANAHLASAIEWVRSLPEHEQRAPIIAVGYECARGDSIKALELAAPLSPGADRDRLLIHAISQWAAVQPETAVAWAMRVSDFDLQQRLLAAAAIAWSDHEGAAAATIVADHLVIGEGQDRAALGVVQRWAQRAPQDAASWVMQFPDSPTRRHAVQSLLALWIPQDSAAAANWLGQLPPGSLLVE